MPALECGILSVSDVASIFRILPTAMPSDCRSSYHHYREGILWVDSQRDIRAFFIYRNRGQLNLKSWLKSLKGEKDLGDYSRDDWKPALVATARLFGDAWSRVRKKVRFMNSSGARG